jgi:PPOX class probable FMN-dependent enzyme
VGAGASQAPHCGEKKTVPQDWKSKFGLEHVITTEHDLRDAAGKPSFWLLTKLDIHCRRFIAASPFVVIASAGAAGPIDTSPKGEAPGFVPILDDCTLALPDRSGNRRFDTFHNLLENPNVGLIFFVPGRRETLRVSGKAIIVRDLVLRKSMAIKGRVPHLAIVTSVERVFFHCSSCICTIETMDADKLGARCPRPDRQSSRGRDCLTAPNFTNEVAGPLGRVPFE